MSKTTEKFGNPFSKLNKDVPDILDDEFKSFYKGLKNPNQLFVNPEKEDNEFYFKRSKEIFDSFIDSYLDNLELDGVKSHLEEIKIFGEENNIDLIKKFVDEKEKYILNLAKIEASSKLHNSSFFFSDKTKASANQDEVIINNSTLGKEKENNINAGIKNSSVEQLVSPAEPQLSELQKLQNQTKEEQIEFFSRAFTQLFLGKPTFNFLSDDFQNFCKQSSDLHIKLWLKKLILLYIEKKLQSLSSSDLTKLEGLIEGFKIGHKEVQIESSGNKAHEVTSNTYPHEDSELEYIPERNERWLKEAERFTNASEQECLDILANLEKGCLIEKWLQNKDKKFFAGKESFLINYTFKENTFNYEIFNFLLSQGLFYENIKNVNLKISKEGFDNLSSLALRHEDENLIKWLAEKNSLTLKNYFGHPEYEPISAQDELTLKFLEEMIKNGNITLPSLYNGETFLDLFKLLINLSPTFWEDLRNPKKCQFDIKDQSLSGLELAQYLDNIEKLLKGDTSPLRESLFNEYLSTDLESVKKLFEKGLIDLHYVELCAQNTQFSHRNLGISSSQPTAIESDACEKIIAYAIKQDISTRIEKAAKAGNVRLLEQIYSNDKELFYEAFNNPKKQFVNMLKEAVHEVLKSGDIKKVTGKINIKSVSKSKIATDKDLEELLKKPNLLKQIIDYICEKFLCHIGIKSKFQTHAANISEAFVQKLPGNKTHQSKGKQT